MSTIEEAAEAIDYLASVYEEHERRHLAFVGDRFGYVCTYNRAYASGLRTAQAILEVRRETSPRTWQTDLAEDR